MSLVKPVMHNFPIRVWYCFAFKQCLFIMDLAGKSQSYLYLKGQKITTLTVKLCGQFFYILE